jgi:hypothetical protein
VQFSGLAIDILWRLSGGWPGLVQLLCYEVIEILRRDGKSIVADVGVVKKASGNIIQSPDYKDLLAYLLGSLTINEFLLLGWLVNSGRIQLETSEILGIRSDTSLGYRIELHTSDQGPFECPEDMSKELWNLKEKEIIEDLGGRTAARLRLRVGLLVNKNLYLGKEYHAANNTEG